jgi:hypothetical protein
MPELPLISGPAWCQASEVVCNNDKAGGRPTLTDQTEKHSEHSKKGVRIRGK